MCTSMSTVFLSRRLAVGLLFLGIMVDSVLSWWLYSFLVAWFLVIGSDAFGKILDSLPVLGLV